MKENIFQGQWSHSIEKYCLDNNILHWYYKITDTASKIWISAKKPFDCCLYMSWVFTWMELKSTLELKSFSVDKVKGHQLYNLLKIKQSGGNAWVIIYITEFNQTAVFDVEHWINISEQFQKAYSKKSIPNKQLLLLCNFTIKKEMAYWWNFLRLTYPRETSLNF